MKQGLYEQIINNLTRRQLSDLDPSLYDIGIEQLDAEEARKQLSNYFAAVTRRAFSPSTLYEDYAINERLFHWQTQSRISEETNTAKRYIHHKQMGNRIALFVREYKEENNFTSPFVFLGEAEYVRHEGNKPMSFIWRLKEEMPPELVPVANKAIG